jgi:hypothetical protein
MTLPTLLSAIVEALRDAGATEEMIAAATKRVGRRELPTAPGRPSEEASSRSSCAESFARRCWSSTGKAIP